MAPRSPERLAAIAAGAPQARESQLDRVERKLDLALRLLEQSRGPRLTARDWCLLEAIAEHVGQEVAFGATELMRHADVVKGDLSAAITDCRLKDATAMGRRLKRISRGYLGLAPIGRDEFGVIWILTTTDATASARHEDR